MADTNQLLEVLQADVYAVLKATPAIALANVIVDNEGDIEAKVAKALSTLTATGGKNGLAVVVLLPEVTEGEKNLPGPPLTVKIEVRVLENVLLNRAAATGSLMRSSQAALSVLSVLQHTHLGSCFLSCEKDPVTPVEVKKGHVSHAVTLYAKFSGFVTPKPLGVEAAMISPVVVTGMLTDGEDPVMFPLMTGGEARTWASAGASHTVGWLPQDGIWRLFQNSPTNAVWVSDQDVATPDLVTNWQPGNDETGTPVVTLGASALQLTCSSSASNIRYTTDGSYPSPTKTLYTAPITGLATGTVVRAAAYVAGMPPGDVLELTITD